MAQAVIEMLWYHKALKAKAVIRAGELLFLYHKKTDSRDVITFKCILILHSAFPSQQTLFHLNKMDITYSTAFYIKCSCKGRTTTLE